MQARDPSQKLGFLISYGVIPKLRFETAENPSYECFEFPQNMPKNMFHCAGPGPFPKVKILNVLSHHSEIAS